MKRQGVSNIIATVLIIAIVIVIAGITAAFLSNTLQKTKDNSPNINEVYYDAKIQDIKIEDSTGLATNPSQNAVPVTQKITILVKRNDNEQSATGIQFLFYSSSGNSYSYNSNDPPNDPGIIKQYEITNSDINMNDFSTIEKVSISLIYRNNKITRILDEKSI